MKSLCCGADVEYHAITVCKQCGNQTTQICDQYSKPVPKTESLYNTIVAEIMAFFDKQKGPVDALEPEFIRENLHRILSEKLQVNNV
jgi:hypothetical protein